MPRNLDREYERAYVTNLGLLDTYAVNPRKVRRNVAVQRTSLAGDTSGSMLTEGRRADMSMPPGACGWDDGRAGRSGTGRRCTTDDDGVGFYVTDHHRKRPPDDSGYRLPTDERYHAQTYAAEARARRATANSLAASSPQRSETSRVQTFSQGSRFAPPVGWAPLQYRLAVTQQYRAAQPARGDTRAYMEAQRQWRQ